MNWAIQAFAFALFELWLISFPLGNDLLSNGNILLYFLIPHTISLFVIASFMKSSFLEIPSKVAIAMVIFFTLAFPFLQDYKQIIFILIAIFSAPMVIRACSILNNSSYPFISAGIGLSLGNGLVLMLIYLPFDISTKLFILGLSLIPIIFLPHKTSTVTDLKKLRIQLPFIYLFYLVGGLFYSFLMPEYASVAIVRGLELIFYIVPIIVSIFLIVERNKEFLSILGIFFGVISFSIFYFGDKLLINLSMFASQTSFALVDFYLVCFLISTGGSIKTFGYGLGVMCLAILSGFIISQYATSIAFPIVSAGNIILTLSILVFYFMAKRLRT